MKIGMVLPYSIAHGGGVKEIAFAMQKELNRRGHEVYIITPQPRGTEVVVKDHTILVGVSADFHWAPLHTTVQISSSEGEEIDALLAEYQFDVLHFHEPWVPVLGRQILTRSQTANVATFHGSLPDGIISQAFGKVVTPYTKPLLKYIDEFVAAGDVAAQYVCSLTDARVAIIPVGVDVQEYVPPKQFKEDRKNKTIFFVGRLENRKGVKHLLRAFQLLQAKRPEVSLVVAGNGPDRAKLTMMAEDLGLQNVTFTGFISNEDKIKYMQTSDLFCAPALYGESTGLVLLEAMACGLPAVAGDNPGYSTVMQGLGAVSLVNPKHSEDFARRLELMLYEKELRAIWRDWSAKELPQYTYETIIDQYEVIYAKAIAKHAEREREEA